MKCTCPKCKLRIELVLPSVDETGSRASCPNCKATLTVFAESFAARALRRTGEISCASCGNELGPHVYCESCGTTYPQYLVHSLGRKKACVKEERFSFRFRLKSSPFSKGGREKRPSQPLDSPLGQGGPVATPTGDLQKQSHRGLMAALAVLLLVVGGFAGFTYYTKWKTESAYMKNFARAAYGVQVGVETSRRVCQKMAGDWQASVDAGKPFPPRPSADDERELQAIGAKLEGIKSKCAEEPEKFQNCNLRLVKIEESYKKLQTLALSPGNSLPGFIDAVNKVEAEHKQATVDFRSGMPAELMEELHEASKIYRDLKPLLQ